MPIATHLLLDPKLPEEIRAYFRDRAANNSPPFECVEVEGYDPHERLRELARSVGLSAIVALANKDHVTIFDKAAVRHSQVSTGPNGWVLTEFPEAVPLPAVKPPALWDERGQPLIPDPTFNARKRTYDNYRREYQEGTVASFGEAGAIRSYQFTDWIASNDKKCHWLDEPTVGRSVSVLATDAGQALLSAARNKPAEATYLWRVEKRFFTVGPRTPAIEAVARHHPVEEPTEAAAVLRDALGKLNPWRQESWNPVREAVQMACGLDLSAILTPAELPKRLELGFPNGDRKRVASNPPDIATARRFLEELASRDVHASSPSDAFLFQAISEAPLRWEPKPPNRLSRVIFANLGAGHLVEIAAYLFPGEAPDPLVDVTEPSRSSRYPEPRRFDGRDVRLQITEFTSELLEGTSLMAKKRRAAAAEDYD